MSAFIEAREKFCKEKAAGTVASLAWLFLLHEIPLRALICRWWTPEKRNTPKHTTDVDFFYVNALNGDG